MNTYAITTILAGVIVFFHAFGGPAAAGEIAAKPQQPVAVTIGPALPGASEGVPQPGDVVEFSATASALVDTTDLRVEVKLLGAFELVKGALEWSGPLKKGETRTIYFTVRIPESGKGKLKAVATLRRDGRKPVHNTSMYVLGEADQGTEYRLRKDGKGRNVIEY